MADDPKFTSETECYLKEQRTGKHVVTKDDWCSGCKQWICDACSINFSLPFGGHDPMDHLDDTYDDDDDFYDDGEE